MSLPKTIRRWSSGFLCALVLALSIIVPAAAQNVHRITGTITGANGQPIAGVAVIVKNGSAGTTTDEKGAFALLAKTGDVLQVSNVGYQQQEITVGNSPTLFITLSETTRALDDIVVIGYGSQKKKVLTGATAHVSNDDLAKNHSVSLEQALQGQAAGVQITSNSGQPGDAFKIKIRGLGTNGGFAPLFLVDGVPTDDISYLNPNDIESLDILKDAASAAIYGTRAANGLVLITTKKGKAGRKSISFDAYYGWQNPARKLDLLNAHEYGIIMNEASVNSGKTPIFSDAALDTLGAGTDWQAAVTRKNAITENYSLGMTGGNDQSVYSSSLTYQKQQGIIGLPGRSFFERITFRINSEHKLYKDIVKFGQNLTYTHSNQSGIGTGNIYNNSIRGLLNTSPTFPVYNADGSYAKSTMNSEEVNPVGMLDYTNNNKYIYDRIFGDAYIEATIFKGLKFRSDYGLDLSFNSSNTFIPVYDLSANNINTLSTAGMGMYRNSNWNWDNTLNYQHSFGKHNINVLAGTNARLTDAFSVSGTKQDLIIPDLEHAILDNGTNTTTQKAYGTRTVNALNSYFGRLIYNYNDKYLLTAIVRTDGSTRFGPNKRWGTFPSFSGGWVVSNEDFLKTNWLSFLKIRAGWGQNGNDRIGDYTYLATVNSLYQYYYFGGASATTGAVGTSPDKIPNPNVKWETSQQADIGFDATVFKSLTINFDWYNKKTKDLLVLAPIPATVGTGAPYINGGDVSNKGVELALNYTNKIGEVNFTIGGNIAFNTNKVLRIATADGILHGATAVLSSAMDEFYRMQAGYPIGYFYGLKTAGIFQNQQEIDNYKSKSGAAIQPTAKPGDVRFVDLDGDGSITANDKTNVGNPNPKANYGFNLSASYKGFDIAVLLSGVTGNQIVDGTRAYDRFYNNYTTAVFGRWTGEGTSNHLPRVTLGDEANNNWGRFSDLYVHNGDFLRVKSINIGYDLKRSLLKHLPLQQCRIYASGINLFTFTKYRGLDPEIGYGNESWSSGVDLGYYPQPRTIMLGLSVKL